MGTFLLPDLGEGLPEAEIVTWHVKEGDSVTVDQPMVSVETAKAVVEVPAPQTGVISKLYAGEGDVVATGAPLVDFDGESDVKADTPAEPAPTAEEPAASDGDSGTVVGAVPTSNKVVEETAIIGGSRRRRTGRVKAAPAVRAKARRLGIDLKTITPTGKQGQVTLADLDGVETRAPAAPMQAPAAMPPAFGKPEPLRGPRRAMAQAMSASRDQVAACTLFDDADIHYWAPGQDITVRTIRAIAAACQAEPALNGWYDDQANTRTLFDRVDLAMAVDTPSGLIVPVLRDVGNKDAITLRGDVDWVKKATRERTVAPEHLRNPTITLSNFGMLAGRYGSVVIVPPMIAIVGAGGIRHDVVPVMGGIETHRRIPLSLSFDHRCVTGGEACRFLAALIADLSAPN